MSGSPNLKPQPVSVVLPVLNEARYLRAAVGSILDQDYAGDIEVVLALGPSKDSSNKVAADIASKDSRVSVVHNPSGRTPTGLNLALAQTRFGDRRASRWALAHPE